jgi:hypothetical protein
MCEADRGERGIWCACGLRGDLCVGGLVKPLGRVGGPSALVFCLAAASGAAPGATAPASSAAGYENQLFGVAALSPANVWAVGIHCTYSCGAEPQGKPLVVHWDGTAWSKVKIQGLGYGMGAINAVSAFSPSDIWAVGYRDIPSTRYTAPLTLHWNGTAWSVVASPTGAGLLQGVSAISATGAWAVGDTENPDPTVGTLAMRWNGTTWSTIPSPDPGPFGYANELRSVAATSPDNAWAVGYYTSRSGPSGQRLILHWNGTAWSQAASPNPSSAESALTGVSATSAASAWAVGQYCPSRPGGCAGTRQDTLILHWNGTAWSRHTSPSPGTGDYLHAVTARTTTDAWAVGNDQNRTGSLDTLILHWDGIRWSRVSSPSSSAFNYLFQVSTDSARDAWAVGYYCTRNCTEKEIDHSLILHWNGTTWSKK